MDPKSTGGCQCGNLRYCTDCQRQSGSAFGMTLVVNEADFRITQGDPKSFSSLSDRGRAKLGVFCPDCGTRIYHKTEWRKGTVSVKPGTLDDTRFLQPDVHIWTGSKQPWITIPDGIEAHDIQPT